MPLTAPQALLFWTEQAQMSLPDRTRLKLAAEGLTTPTDFIDFPEKDDLDALILKCLKPAKIAGGAAANARLRESGGSTVRDSSEVGGTLKLCPTHYQVLSSGGPCCRSR